MLKKKEDFNKMKKEEKEPQYYRSLTGGPAYNYRVYYLKAGQKIIYFLLAFIVGAVVGYLFYGGIGKNADGNATLLTYILNTLVCGIVGTAAGFLFLPVRQKQLLDKQQVVLRRQFRDMLEALSTSLSAGKNVTESFLDVYNDLKTQYESGSYILEEMQIINSGLANGLNIEEILKDFGYRSGNGDIQDFANVFEVCYRRGGNIKDTIRNTYEILNDKMNITEEIETIVSGSKNELMVMMVMPPVMVGMMKGLSPDFASNFTSSSGIMATSVAVVLFVAAYFVGRKVLEIKM